MHGDETPTYGVADWFSRVLLVALAWRLAPACRGLPFDEMVGRYRADANPQPWSGDETPTDPVTVKPQEIPAVLHGNAFRKDLKETLGLDREAVLGYDVSAHQGLVDHASFRDAGYMIGIAKATEGGGHAGKGYVDKRFAENWLALEREGLVRTCYHFARASERSSAGSKGFEKDGENEALWLLEHYGSTVKPGMLPPVLDIEWDKRASAAKVRATDVEEFCVAFVNTVHVKLGVWPLVYTGPNFWKYRLRKSMALSDCPLWLVTGYPNTFEPSKKKQIPGWDWFLHQHTNKAKRPDVPGRTVDANYFRGSPADLRAMAGISEDAVPVLSRTV